MPLLNDRCNIESTRIRKSAREATQTKGGHSRADSGETAARDHEEARTALHQHHSHPRHGRGAEGQQRPSRHAHGAGAAGLRAVGPLSAATIRAIRKWPGRDRFILSNGHACMLLYAMLHLTGYDLSLDDIKQFRQWESKTPGHPEYRPRARARSHDRPARTGRRQFRRHGDCAALAGRAVRQGRLAILSTIASTPSAAMAI